MLDRRIQAEVPHAAMGFCSEKRGNKGIARAAEPNKISSGRRFKLTKQFRRRLASTLPVVNVLKGSICLVPTKRQVEREITHAYIPYRTRIVNQKAILMQSSAIVRSA